MATVPTVQGPSVAASPIPGAYQATPQGLGIAGAARAEQTALVGKMVQAFQGQRQREDADTVSFAEAKFKEEWIEQKRLVQQRMGRDAWGVTDQTKRWVDDTAHRYTKDMTPEQRKLFRQSVDQIRLSAVAVAGAHEDDQRKVATVEAVQARIAADTNVAASSPNPLEVDNARNTINAGVERLAGLNGWEPERIALEKQRQLGALHVQVLQTLVERDPMNASAYLDANRSEIPGGAHAELERTVRIGLTKLQAQAFADRALAENLPEADAVEMIRKKYSGDQEDTLVTVLKSRYAERAAQRERVQNEAAERAWTVVDRGGGWDSIPTAVQSALDPRTSIAIKSHLKEKANSQGVDRTRTDWTLYAQLRDEALADPAGFSKRNLVQYFDRLAPAEREKVLDLRTQKASQITEARTLESQIRTTTRELKLGDGSVHMEKRGQLEDAIRTAIDVEAKAKGKALNADERQSVIDRVTYQVVTHKGVMWDSTEPAFLVPPDKRAKAPPTAEDRKAIIERFKARGVTPTEDQIMNTFRAWRGL